MTMGMTSKTMRVKRSLYRRLAVLLSIPPILGVLAALGLAPFHWVVFLIVAFSGLLWILDRTEGWPLAALAGWLFGLGFFVAGLYWIVESFYVDADRFGAFSIPALIGLSAILALFTALACACAKIFGCRGLPLLLTLSACWSAAEWLRGNVLTGFPWNLIGYAWGAHAEPLQALSIAGAYGLSLVTVVIATLPGLIFIQASPTVLRWLAPFLTVGIVVLLWAYGANRLANADDGDGSGIRIRVVQPNIPQEMKWNLQQREQILGRLIELTNQPGKDEVDAVVWPEAAIPYVIDEMPELRASIAEFIPSGVSLITGVVRRAPDFATRPGYFNSMIALNQSGDITAAYDKNQLVPFGEYMPFRSYLPFPKLTEGTVDFIPGQSRSTLIVPGLPVFEPLICYEAIFPGWRWEGPRPEWLLNLTNDAWFGVTSGPFQHFLAARARAIEEGLPMVRAANTGISAVVDGYGRIIALLPLNNTGKIDAELPKAITDRTIYSRVGDLPLLLAVAILICLGAMGRNHRARQETQP